MIKRNWFLTWYNNAFVFCRSLAGQFRLSIFVLSLFTFSIHEEKQTSEKTEKKKNVRKISERKKMQRLCFNYLCKRKKVDDRSDNDCEIREITEYFSFFSSFREDTDQYSTAIWPQINMCADSISFFRSFDFDWNALACSCCGRYVQIKQSNTIVDRSTKMHWMWSVQKKKRNGQRAAEHHQNQQQQHTRIKKKICFDPSKSQTLCAN